MLDADQTILPCSLAPVPHSAPCIDGAQTPLAQGSET